MKKVKILRAVVSIPDYPIPVKNEDVEDEEEPEEESPQIPAEIAEQAEKEPEPDLEERQAKDT
jgi:hypothetical protein